MKKGYSLFFLSVLTSIVILDVFSGCKKETVTVSAPVCDVKGIYSGTNLSSTGVSSTLTYKLQENNFAIGSVTPGGTSVTFGGYRNTCDSVFISAYYAGNNSYYLLAGKLINSNATISGTFKNLTTPTDFGTFSISK
jgi:hypothetical protein